MSNFLFISGQIRAMEADLLNMNRLDRMIGATKVEDAFRVMVELQYAKYFDEATKPQDFARIIEKGLLETKDLIVNGTNNHEGLQFLWRRFDLNNLKRALKLKLLEGKNSIESFSNADGFSGLGNFTGEQIQAMIFAKDGGALDLLPKNFRQAIEEADDIFETRKAKLKEGEAAQSAFRYVEFALDQAHFDYLRSIARGRFLKTLYQFIVNSTNFRSLTRSLFIMKEPLPPEAVIPYGDIYKLALSKEEALETTEGLDHIENFEEFVTFGKNTLFAPAVWDLREDMEPGEIIQHVERGIDQQYRVLVHDAQEGEIGSIQIPMSYFERRLKDAKMLKFIMFAKFHGLDSESIYEGLKNF